MARYLDFSVKFASTESDRGVSAEGGMQVVRADEQWSKMLSS
jgi:hypothetical protein